MVDLRGRLLASGGIALNALAVPVMRVIGNFLEGVP